MPLASGCILANFWRVTVTASCRFAIRAFKGFLGPSFPLIVRIIFPKSLRQSLLVLAFLGSSSFPQHLGYVAFPDSRITLMSGVLYPDAAQTRLDALRALPGGCFCRQSSGSFLLLFCTSRLSVFSEKFLGLLQRVQTHAFQLAMKLGPVASSRVQVVFHQV